MSHSSIYDTAIILLSRLGKPFMKISHSSKMHNVTWLLTVILIQHGTTATKDQSRCIPITDTVLCNSTCSPCTNNECSRECTYCKDGYYGLGCTSPCHGNCKNSRCVLMQSGSALRCLDGCEPGWMGLMCGTTCKHTCSECRQDGQCTKCKEGRYGNWCTYNCRPLCRKCHFQTGACTECKKGMMDNITNACFEKVHTRAKGQPPTTVSVTNTDVRLEETTFVLQNKTLSEITKESMDKVNPRVNNDGFILKAVSFLCVLFLVTTIGVSIMLHKRRKRREIGRDNIPFDSGYLTPSPLSENIYDEIDEGDLTSNI